MESRMPSSGPTTRAAFTFLYMADTFQPVSARIFIAEQREVVMRYLTSTVRRWIGWAFSPAAVSCSCYRHCPLDHAPADRG